MSEYIYEETTDSDGVICYIKRGVIVRCKDCKYYRLQDIGDVCTRPNGGLWHITTDTYCSYGEEQEHE